MGALPAAEAQQQSCTAGQIQALFRLLRAAALSALTLRSINAIPRGVRLGRLEAMATAGGWKGAMRLRQRIAILLVVVGLAAGELGRRRRTATPPAACAAAAQAPELRCLLLRCAAQPQLRALTRNCFVLKCCGTIQCRPLLGVPPPGRGRLTSFRPAGARHRAPRVRCCSASWPLDPAVQPGLHAHQCKCPRCRSLPVHTR